MDIALPLIGGLLILIGGAELLVRGSVRLAERFGVSSLLIGLTVVGFGTSTPELVTSIEAALYGSPGIAVGNIVGSNIFNIFVILGISALILPLAVAGSALRRDGTWVLGTALLLTAIGWTWTLDRGAAALMLVLLASYLVVAYRQERRHALNPELGHPAAIEKGQALESLDPSLEPRSTSPDGVLSWLRPLVLALAGLAMLIVGGSHFVTASIELARLMGVSETIIGLTIVAAGTSMPELATSTIAAIRRQTDVAVGNVLGSNIYNILGIGGVTALISPTKIPAQIASFDSFVMVGATLLLLLFLWSGRRITRLEGGILVSCYALYVWWIWPT